MKKSTMKDIATSSTTIVFVIISVTGIMLYFHLFNGYIKSLHEILGLLFVAAAAFHIFVNWKSMKNYFSKKIFLSFLILFTLISASFITQSLEQTANPKKYVLQHVMKAPLQTSFKILNLDEQAALALLQSKGFTVSKQHSIQSIAKENRTSPFEIIALLIQ